VFLFLLFLLSNLPFFSYAGEFVLTQGYFLSTARTGRIVFTEMLQKVVHFNNPTQVSSRTVARVESTGSTPHKPAPKKKFVWYALLDDGARQDYVESEQIEKAYQLKGISYLSL
jgi:hypothetical protein